MYYLLYKNGSKFILKFNIGDALYRMKSKKHILKVRIQM